MDAGIGIEVTASVRIYPRKKSVEPCNLKNLKRRQRGKNKYIMDSGEIIIPVLGILLPLIITLGAFIMIVYLRKFQNIERMSIIDKGLSPDLFFKKQSMTPSTMRWALLLVGIGTGFLMGYWLDRAFDMEEVGYFSMLFIFGGIGLALAHFFDSKNKEKE